MIFHVSQKSNVWKPFRSWQQHCITQRDDDRWNVWPDREWSASATCFRWLDKSSRVWDSSQTLAVGINVLISLVMRTSSPEDFIDNHHTETSICMANKSCSPNRPPPRTTTNTKEQIASLEMSLQRRQPFTVRLQFRVGGCSLLSPFDLCSRLITGTKMHPLSELSCWFKTSHNYYIA